MREYKTILFDSDELDMEKHVYVYLPRSYDKDSRQYPVLYMHDGQNLFDDKLAYQHRGWRIMDLYAEYPDIPEVIIVGIESDGRTRSNQLIPYPFYFQNNNKAFGGLADQYLTFIINTVKPYIDDTYRTYKNRKNTAIMGSSFGGVCSLYAILKYSNVFARAACISSAFHFAFFEPLKQDAANVNKADVKKLYMDIGTMETDDANKNALYMKRNQEMADVLKSHLDDNQFLYQEIEGAIHHEKAWEKRFPDVMRYLFNS